MNSRKVLVVGAGGQIGTELVMELRATLGADNVVATDVKDKPGELKETGPFEMMDILDANALHTIVKKYEITEVYLLAALLSATAEQKIKTAWKLNMEGLFNVLDMAREKVIQRVFWPSSIAVFGPGTPGDNTPQDTIMDPSTVYGISKLAGERWCEYYHQKFGVDVRSLRYPGLIGYKSEPGGGTTDYAVHIFHEALENGKFECFLSTDTALPMMYMPDALRATISLMDANATDVKIRSAYNLAGMSFSPANIADEIKKHIPSFTITYKPDERQAIAASWPRSIDDSRAQSDWGWKPEYNLASMTTDMLKQISLMKEMHAAGKN